MRKFEQDIQIQWDFLKIHAETGTLFPNGQGRTEHHTFEKCGLCHSDKYPRIIFLPYSWNGIPQGGGDLNHVVHHSIGLFHKVDYISMPDVGKNRKEPLENMTKRQKREDLLIVLHPVLIFYGSRHPGNIFVCQHGPLGRTGRPGRVDKDRQVFRRDIFHTFLKKIRMFLDLKGAHFE